MRAALLGLLLAPAGCSGLNLDEVFVSTHGATLASVECRDVINGSEVYYQATMFWDGSVLAHGQTPTNSLGSGSKFHERADADRAKGSVPLRPFSGSCQYGGLLEIESGDLNLYLCDSGALTLDGSLDVSANCSVLNDGLFG